MSSKPTAGRITPAIAAALVVLSAAVAVAAADDLQAPPGMGDRCGTWRTLGPAATSAEVTARPSPGTFQAGSTHFIVHYEDAGLALYAQDVSDAAERAWRVLVDTLLYNAPPSDGAGGGDARTDIYLKSSLGGAWGSTFFETQVGVPYTNSYTSWVEVVDTLSFDRRRVVAAHEFFHVVQVGYDAMESVSFLEMISTWAEDRVYDDVDLYLDVLPFFFDQPTKALYSFVYSNVPWTIYLTERYGDGVLHDILDACAATPGVNVTAATDAALAPHGSSQIDAFQTFTLWNYFTGARDDGMHYTEGAAFPEVYVGHRLDCPPLAATSTTKMGRLACAYVMLDGNAHSDSLELTFTPEWEAQTVVTVNRFKQGVVSSDAYVYPTFTPAGTVTLADWPDCDSVLVIPQIETTTISFNSFALAARPLTTAPPSDPYVLVLDRDACRAPFDGVGDEYTARDGEEWPFAEAVGSLGYGCVLSDSIPSDLTLCGGVFVVGGHDGADIDLDASDLAALIAFMDGGGDVYVEGNQFGRWVSSPEETAFWSYFGCTFTAGNATSTGNVQAWNTLPSGAVGSFAFAYDYQDDPDDSVGRLTPVGADTLAVDQSGNVRMTRRDGPNGSTRIMSTVLLGGSTAVTGTRTAFVSAVIDLFDSIVDALAVADMRIDDDGATVRIVGTLDGYGGETLRMRRGAGGGVASVPLDVTGSTIRAADRPPVGTELVYRLEVVEDDGAARVLWQQSYTVRAPSPFVSLVNAFPNPARGDVTLVVNSDRAQSVDIAVYNVAGQRVLATRAAVGAGTTQVPLAGGVLGSGVYFVRVGASGRFAERKLHILR